MSIGKYDDRNQKANQENDVPYLDTPVYVIFCCALAGILIDKSLFYQIKAGNMTELFGAFLLHFGMPFLMWAILKATVSTAFGKKINQSGGKGLIYGLTLAVFAVVYYVWRVVIFK